MVMFGTNRPSITSTWTTVGARGLDRADLLGEAAEVGGQDRGAIRIGRVMAPDSLRETGGVGRAPRSG